MCPQNDKREVARYMAMGMMCLLITGCQTAANIDKGLYSASNSVAARDRVTGDRTLNLTPRAEQIKKSNALAVDILKKYDASGMKRDAALDPVLYNRIDIVFARILPVSHMRDEKWTVVLFKDDEFNARTIGGTYIFVNTGLFKWVQTDDELAAVMGHELAHVAANHVYEKQAALIGLMHKKNSAKATGRTAAFTIAQEEEADRIGILYAALAGYDPFAASRVWATLYKEMGNNHDGYTDHPVNGDRERQTRTVAEKVKRYYTPGKQNPDFVAILDNNTLWSKKKGGSAGHGGGLLAVLDAATTTYVTNTNARTEQMKQERTMQQLALLRQGTTLAGITAAGPNTLRVWFEYRGGSLAVKDSVFAATVSGPDGQKTYRATHPGWVYGNTRFYVDFTDPTLNASQVTNNNVTFSVADIDPL